MKLEQSFEVAAPLDRVWAALIDVERVVPCLPGAEVTGRNDDGTYNGSFRVKIGPTAAAYVGKLEMTSVDEAAHVATMAAAGTDRRGQGGARANIISSVKEGEAGMTVVDVVTDYSITGRLARFGRGGMIEEIGNRLLTEFASSLQTMLAGPDAGPGEYETFVGMPAVGAKDAPAPEGDKPARKPRKDLAAAAEAVAAASEPAAPEPTEAPEPEPEPEPADAEPEPEPAPEPEPEADLVPDLAVEAAAEDEAAVEAAAEEELAAVMPEASVESEPEPEPEPAPPPAPDAPPPPPLPEPPPPPTPEPPPPPPLHEPEPATEPPPPPPPPTAEPEPLDGLALARTVIVERVKSHPVPIVALLLGLLLLRRRRRRGGN